MATLTALYDASVLYPAPLRDLLMQLAVTDLFRAKWTEEILEEWVRNVHQDRPDIPIERLKRTRQKMNQSVPDCLVYGYQDLIPALRLPDPDDRHVLAAAISGRADVIITMNLRDFPTAILGRYNIDAQHPDEFINRIITLNAPVVCQSVRIIRERLRNPPKTVAELLETYERQGLIKTAAQLREWVDLL